VGAEALCRWNHPERGLVMPDDFIPLAEESRLILPLGEWVTQQACSQNKAWQEKGLPPITVSVNLSAFQFHKHTLVFSILKALEKSGLDPKYLELEITESLAMKNAGFTLAMLQDLAANGLRLALDDFGKGYSSLTYLKRFPIHSLKIDQSFVADLETQPRDASIVNAMIILAHNLNLEVVAEGVERKTQMDFLRRHNCDRVQGYYFARPVPVAEFEKILIESKGQNFLDK
jgi:EAL domain-containing protein (putative c-di-GMP-specific phosphodiesterase class I)